MSDEKALLEVGDIVRVKRALGISANLVNRNTGTILDGRIGQVEAVSLLDNGGAIYSVRLWWYGAQATLTRSQLEYLPGTHDDWREEAMKHPSLDSYFVRTPETPSDGDPLE